MLPHPPVSLPCSKSDKNSPVIPKAWINKTWFSSLTPSFFVPSVRYCVFRAPGLPANSKAFLLRKPPSSLSGCGVLSRERKCWLHLCPGVSSPTWSQSRQGSRGCYRQGFYEKCVMNTLNGVLNHVIRSGTAQMVFHPPLSSSAVCQVCTPQQDIAGRASVLTMLASYSV